MKRTLLPALALGALLLSTAFAWAGEQGRLLGSVKDEGGNPIEGASITLTTKSLTTFKMTLKTNKKGEFATILNNATWTYHAKIEKEGFTSYEQDIKVPVGDKGEINARLTPAGRAAATSPQAISESDKAAMAYNEGVDLLGQGDRAGAQAKFEESVKIKPDLVAGWQTLTKLAFEDKRWDKVIESGKKAIELDPSLSDLFGWMAEAARKIGDKAAAAEFEKKYEEANPDSPEIVYNKGIDAYNKGKMKEASELLKKATELKADWPEACYWLGMSYLSQNKAKDMKAAFAKYLELAPNGKYAAEIKETMALFK